MPKPSLVVEGGTTTLVIPLPRRAATRRSCRHQWHVNYGRTVCGRCGEEKARP